MKPVIIYFSYTNHTKEIAYMIKDELNCDIYEIKTIIPYSSDYDEVVEDEQNSQASTHLPDIVDLNINLDAYDTIILGTPVWWYRPAPAIRTFLVQYNLENKVIIPYATNAGWLGKTFKEIKKLAHSSIVEKEMSIKYKSYSDDLITKVEDIKAWIKSFN